MLSHVRLFATLWPLALQAPLSMGFFRQQYWSGNSSKGSSWPRDLTHVSWVFYVDTWILYQWAIREVWHRGLGDSAGKELACQYRRCWRKSVLNIHWKDWCLSWSFNTLATWCEEQTHWKRPRHWERLKAGEGNDRGWDGWMGSLIQWAWVSANSERWWRAGKPGVLQSMRSQRVG